jgi:hypothetical protein
MDLFVTMKDILMFCPFWDIQKLIFDVARSSTLHSAVTGAYIFQVEIYIQWQMLVIYGLFNGYAHSSDYIMSSGRMVNE